MNPVIATIGMFDGVHTGHRHLLRTLQSQADALSLHPVVFTFDRHPQQVLHGADAVRLLTTGEERLSRLREAGTYDVVVLPFDTDMADLSACRFYETVLRAHAPLGALLMGYDNVFGNKRHDDFGQLRELLQRDGVLLISDTPVYLDGVAVSSTQIRRALQSGDIGRANAMLGYRYTLSGTVVVGRRIGRTLGFPTANLDCDRMSKLLPADGVYAVIVSVDGAEWRGVANLGAQPTVGGLKRSLEIHLIDFHAQLYGMTLTVSFMSRLRDIRAFDSRDALAAQIQSDIDQCKRCF